MKKMQRIFSLVLALVLVLGMAVGASAVQTVDVQTDGHVYNVYQIFSGTQTSSDATLTDIEWGSGVDAAGLLAALKADEKVGSYFTACATANDVAKVLSENYNNETVKNAFANIAVNYLTAPVMNGEKALQINDDTQVVDLAAGYYLFLDVTEKLEQGHAHNPALLQVTKAGNITIEKKTTVPELEKAISDGTEQGIQKVDAMIGTYVKFQITSTLPTGMGHYSEYEYIIHDDIPVGMEVSADSVKVYLMADGIFANKKLVTGGYTLTTADGACRVFGAAEEPTNANGYSNNSCDLEVTFADLKQSITLEGGESVKVDANDKFFIEYDALITPAAAEWMYNNVVVLHNDAVLEYPNDPNWNPGDPENEGKEPPKGITPESDAEVYLTKVIVEKVDESKRPLTGAKFTLKKEGAVMAPVVSYGERFVEATEFAEGETKYWLLTDGTYTKTDPATEGVDTSDYADVAKTYKREVYSITGEQEAQTPDEITVEVGETGRVSFSGLGTGTYWLTEAKAPDGYNLLDEPIKLVVSFNHETGTFHYDWRHEGAATALSATMTIQIVNTKGNVLPETGGMGTTLFYAFGGTMVLAATVLLVTKKRMHA